MGLSSLLDLQIGPHHRHPGDARHLRDLRMDLDFAKVLAQFFLLLRGDVLVAQEDDTAFGDEETEFIALLGSQLRKLDAG